MTNVKPLNKNIQKNIFGGSLALPMNPLYVSKKACEIEATSLIVNGKVTGMTILGLAQEIYAHACCFYGASIVKGLGVDSATVDEIHDRANPVNIDDGGDTPARVAIYALIWTLTPTIIVP